MIKPRIVDGMYESRVRAVPDVDLNGKGRRYIGRVCPVSINGKVQVVYDFRVVVVAVPLHVHITQQDIGIFFDLAE